jgi:hypothetical protein
VIDRLRPFVIVALLSCLAACTEGTTDLSDARRASRDGGLDVSDAEIPIDSSCPPGTSTIRGSVTRTYFSSAGVSSEPVDLSDRTYAAISSGQRYGGTVNGPGAFTIPCAPEGEYDLEEEWGIVVNYMRTASREVERLEHARGRAGARYASPGTRIALEIDGLVPWHEGDQLELVTTHEVIPLASPSLGATRLSAVVSLDRPDFLVEAQLGDRAAVVQKTTKQTASGDSYLSIERVFVAPEFSTIDGSIVTLTGTLSLPGRASVSIDLRVPEIAGAVILPSDSQLREIWLKLTSVPASASARWPVLHYPSFDFELLSLVTDDYSHDVVADFSVPAVFADERIVLEVRAVVAAQSGFPITFAALLAVPIELPSSAPIVLRPRMAPVTDVRADSTMSWTRPAFGEPSLYTGVIFPRAPGDNRFIFFETPHSEWTAPPGLLVAGDAYDVEISAFFRSGLSLNRSYVKTSFTP